MWLVNGDADPSGTVRPGDVARVDSIRGWLEAPVRIGLGRDGVVFVPFHYGGNDSHTSGNELTITAWDPVSKQPASKSGAVRLTRRLRS